ncbi:AEC family transporter [Deferribacter abyssi]|uniref:AEC family transporter n=1 Tax=Deferribacter abyssi TaxID=213806 RepID=UPI003C1F3270
MINNILPIFLTIFFGNFLKKTDFIDDNFIKKTNKLIFYFLLPFLLFYKIAKSNIETTLSFKHIGIIYTSIISIGFISFIFLKVLKIDSKTIGTFIMNSFRGNYAYIGLPVSYFTFGDQGLVIASIYMAFIVPFVNLSSIISLTIFSSTKNSSSKIFKQIIFNPLALGCIIGIIFSFFKIKIPLSIDRFLNINSNATLPLALMAIGASINFDKLKSSLKLSLINSLFKLFFLPLIGYIIIQIMKTPMDLKSKVIIILLATPSATVNFVLASTMNGDVNLSANTIIISTILSFFTYSIYLYFFNFL